jgi:UDP-glucose 4-epimerase
MNIAVTGGSGFIGSHVVDKLVDAGHAVRVLDVQAPRREDVDWRRIDIANLDLVAEAVQGCDALFHLAAMANVNDVSAAPLPSVNLNVGATGVTLEAARLAGVRRYVLASTVWVYEASDQRDVDETTPLDPERAQHLYTAEKIAAEFIANTYARPGGMRTTILRYGIPYGPRMREELVMPIFIKKALNGEPISVAGDGLQYRNFVYVEDLARAHVKVLEHDADGTFNLEGCRDVSILEVAQTVMRFVAANAGIVHTPARTGDYQGRNVSRARAKDVLGWEATTAFEDGFRQTLEWFLSRWSQQPQPR